MRALKVICGTRLDGLDGGQQMPKAGYTEHRIFILGEQVARNFTRGWEAGRFLLPWSYMDPAVASCQWVGPRWRYQRKGREAVAQIPLTVTLRTGEIEYRDFHDERYGGEQAFAVKCEHSRLDGVPYRVYNRAFYESNLVEATNRRAGYFLLLNATTGFDLAPIEVSVLVALGQSDLTIAAIAAAIEQSTIRVRAAALSLWRKGKVDLPVQKSLLSDAWTVRRRSDVDA
jgi:hypothetical protein